MVGSLPLPHPLLRRRFLLWRAGVYMRHSMVRGATAALVLTLGVGVTAAAQVQAPTVTLAGVIYSQYAYQLRADSSLVPVSHGNNFDVTRAYLRALGKFPNGIQTQVTIDVDSRRAAANQQTFRLKYAFVSYTPEHSPLTWKMGMIHTPWNDFEESLWDYRMQGTIPMERVGYLTSSDIGIGVDGMWGYDKYAVQAGVYNGEGYSNAPGDQRKDMQVRGSIRLAHTDLAGKAGGLRLSGYTQMGHANGGGARQRLIGMLSYKSTRLTLAGQIGLAQDSTSATTPKQRGRLLSGYGTWRLGDSSRVTLLGRVDHWDPNVDSTSSIATTRLAVEPQTRIIAGIAYVHSPNLRLLLNADLNAVRGGSPSNAFDRARQLLLFQTEVKY